MQKRVPIDCPCCGANDYIVKYKPWVENDDPASLYGAASGVRGCQTLVTCSQCSVIYENPRFADQQIIASYEEASDEEGHDTQFDMRVKSFFNSLNKNADELPVLGSEILDVGTAGGAFIKAAINYGFVVKGVEPSGALVESARRRGFDVMQGTADKLPFDDETFELVCMWDVIEHLTDPNAALLECKRVLKPNGRMLINFPDIGTIQAKLAGKRFWWILSVHLQHFTVETLKTLCKRNGFAYVKSTSHWQTLELGYLAQQAVNLGVPLAKIGYAVMPGFVRRVPIPYYASQTTLIVKKATT